MIFLLLMSVPFSLQRKDIHVMHQEKTDKIHFINGSGDTKVREETRPHFLQGAYLQAFRRTPN